MRFPAIPLAAAAIATTAAPALATWSIILIDTRTGEIAVGSATCLTGFDLRANTPVLIPGIGAATAQSFVDSTGQNRVFIRDRLALGTSPSDIITQLASFDTGHQTRQYGIADTLGRTATFSGSGAGQWAGGQTGMFASTHNGKFGHIAYAIQGNVLTGSPVVTQAATAAIATPGDLAAKLMASMQAARAMGGDGRCSCSPGNPTGCGAPPASFTKSSHIAYMLIARAGDTEGSNGIYRAGASPIAILAADVTGDLRPDLLSANFSGSASVITNQSSTVPQALAPIFGPLPTNYTVGSGARNLTLVNITGDKHRDLIIPCSSANNVTILRGSASGAFAPAGTFPVGAAPWQVAVADFDGINGPDIAAASFNTGAVSLLLNDGAGSFTPSTGPTVDTGCPDVIAANLLSSPAIDLAFLSRNSSRITILRGNGDGTFAFDQFIPTSNGPFALTAADLDGDTDIDLAACSDTARTVQVFLNSGGSFTPAIHTLSFSPTDLAVGDVNGDSRPDIVTGGTSSFATLFNQPGGSFVLDRTYSTISGINGPSLADLDGDGDLDAAFSASNGSVVTVKNLGPGPLLGKFNDGIGCATGDYFMNFNVAFTTANDPDPVITLQTRYDQWRTDLISRPDAVQSDAVFSLPLIPSVGSPTTALTITLRDWRNELVVGEPSWITVTAAPNSPPGAIAAIGPVQAIGESTFRVLVTGGTTPGLARLRVRVNNGIRPVVLMPDPTLSIYAGTCYANCDASAGTPILTANDWACFIQKFALQEPYANCNGSTNPPAINAADFFCFINRYAIGCT